MQLTYYISMNDMQIISYIQKCYSVNSMYSKYVLFIYTLHVYLMKGISVVETYIVAII